MELLIVGLDVVRTDRALAFYDSEKNQAKLWDILAIYAWVDNDISYVQGELFLTASLSIKTILFMRRWLFLILSCLGMNDICSPMVILLENEADAFWCFERAMRRLVCDL